MKQIEALYWISALGSFEAAARKLHASQAAISKRVQELESLLDTPIFDRTRRSARLTEKGEEIAALGREILDLRNRIVECMNDDEVQVRRFHFGVTELTALTWLPQFVQAMRRNYPGVKLAPKVDSSVNLLSQLRDSTIDLIVTPDFLHEPTLSKRPLQQVENVWMCSPGLMATDRVLPLADIARQTLLTLNELSFTSSTVARWFEANKVEIGENLSSNSNVALSGLTVAGLGVAYLPRHYFQHLVDAGLLAIVRTKPMLPKVRYVVAFRNDGPLRFHQNVAMLAKQCCDFSKRNAPLAAAR